MVSGVTISTVIVKTVKMVINFLVIVLYRVGNQGSFLSIGGTNGQDIVVSWDLEILASGVFIGFFIYTCVVLFSFCFGANVVKEYEKSFIETVMNIMGMILFIVVGSYALHYWCSIYRLYGTEKTVGVTVGALCIIEGFLYLGDLILTLMQFSKDGFEFLSDS